MMNEFKAHWRQLPPELKRIVFEIRQQFPFEVIYGTVVLSEENVDDCFLFELILVQPQTTETSLFSLLMGLVRRIHLHRDVTPDEIEKFTIIWSNHASELLNQLQYRNARSDLSLGDVQALLAEFNLRYRLRS